jgi:hypothetical protein
MTTILRGSREPRTLVEALGTSPARLAALIGGVDDAMLDREPGAGEWTARTVAAHLRDDEFMVMRPRIERILVEDEPDLVPFDEQAWAANRRHGADERDALLEGFAVQRAATVPILAGLSEEQWRRLGRQPEIGVFDLRWWVEHVLEHDENHLQQIEAALR